MINIQSLVQFPIPHTVLADKPYTDEEINDIVYQSYGFTPEEIAYIEKQIS